MEKTTFNDLTQYINSGHPLDPVPVKQEREQLAALLNTIGKSLKNGEGYEFEFTGKVVASVVDGQISVSIAGTNGNNRAGDICNVLVALDGQPLDNLRVCPTCDNHFTSRKKKYCDDGCARKAWNQNMKERKAELAKVA